MASSRLALRKNKVYIAWIIHHELHELNELFKTQLVMERLMKIIFKLFVVGINFYKHLKSLVLISVIRGLMN